MTGADAAGAGFLMLAVNVVCAGIGAGIGALIGAVVPFALIGFAVGFRARDPRRSSGDSAPSETRTGQKA